MNVLKSASMTKYKLGAPGLHEALFKPWYTGGRRRLNTLRIPAHLLRIGHSQLTALALTSSACMLALPQQPLWAQDIVRLEPLAIARATSLNDLGTVVDAVMDGQERVYILDSARPGIVVSDAALRPLGVVGRQGSGPGEFREPASIGALTDGRIAVLDRALSRVTIFTAADHEPILEAERTVTINGPAEAMCILGDDSFLVYGFMEGNRLHVVDTTGTRLRSFAPPDAGLSPMAIRLLTKGRIACNLDRDEVIISSRFEPVVEAFRVSTGDRTWTDVLTPFRGITVDDGGTSVTISSGRAGFSLIASILGRGEYRMFQTTYESRTDNVVADSVATYVYSERAEDWMPLRFNLPLLFSLNGELVLSVDQHGPFDTEISTNRLLFVRGRQ